MKSEKQADFLKSFVDYLALEFVDTQKKREKIIKSLEKALKKAVKDQDWKLAAYICQTLNRVLDSYDAVRFNEDVERLKRLMEIVKKKASGRAGTGTPVA